MINSSLDTNQPIYITEEDRELLFNYIYDRETQDLYSDFNGDIKRFYKSEFSAEILEDYCLGRTGRGDYAYTHIGNFLKKEYIL